MDALIAKSTADTAGFVAKLVEKRVVHEGDQWCVKSEDGSKNLGCGSSRGWAEKRLGQVEYFKHAKSLAEGVEDAVVQMLDAGLLVVDDETLKSFIAKHELVGEGADHKHEQIEADDQPIVTGNEDDEVEVGDADTVEEDIEDEEGNYDNMQDPSASEEVTASAKENLVDTPVETAAKKSAYLEARRSFYDTVEKHLQGKHDQKTHGQKGGGGSRAPVKVSPDIPPKKLLADARKLLDNLSADVSESDNKEDALSRLTEALSEIETNFDDGIYSSSKNGFMEDINKFHKDAEWYFGLGSGTIKHLPGQHDQQSHAGAGGAVGQVAHTQAQIKDAAARQHAKDTGQSIAAARKQVGGGAKVPTTKVTLGKDYMSRVDFVGAYGEGVAREVGRMFAGGNLVSTYAIAKYTKQAHPDKDARRMNSDILRYVNSLNTKSLVAKADQACLKKVWGEYYKYYSGKYISAAWTAYRAKDFKRATLAFEKARDGFQPDKNPSEYECLEAWRVEADGQVGGEQKHLPGQHEQQLHAGGIQYRKHGFGIPKDELPAANEMRDQLNLLASTSKKNKLKIAKYNALLAEAKKKYVITISTTRATGGSRLHALAKHVDADEFKGTREMTSDFFKSATEKPIEVEWRITKAVTGEDGVMRWQATTTKFSRDVQGDKVTRRFYDEAIKRFKSKVVPPPFFSVAHYPVEGECDCGYQYKSLLEYLCPHCGQDRLHAGIATDIWIDGDQPKAKGIFFPTVLGKATFVQVKSDIKQQLPHDQRIRISMGFYPDPGEGTKHKSAGQKDFVRGWIEHFAGTRVPVVPETTLEV